MTANLSDLMGAANQAYAEERLADCERLCRSILGAMPTALPALILLGIVLGRQGDPAASVPLFRRAIEIDPRCVPAYQWLSMVYRRLGERTEALTIALKAVSLNPRDVMTLNNAGLCHLDLNEFAPAEACFRKAIGLAPNEATLYCSLGLALQGLRRVPEAAGAFRKSAQLAPSVPALVALRQIATEAQDPASALEYSKAILRLQPDSSEANLWVAKAFTDLNKGKEAEPYLQRAAELEPDSAAAYSMLGAAFQEKGRLDEAEARFRKSIELQPQQSAAYLALATNRKMTTDDQPIIDRMRALVEGGALSPHQVNQLRYALGKAMEDLGDYATAFKHFDEANRLALQVKYGDAAFNRKSFEDGYSSLIRTYNKEGLDRPPCGASSSDFPIFVVGMIRSGTTLVEQILSSHPEVGAAGEQRFWPDNLQTVMRGNGEIDFPLLQKLAGRYETMLRGIAPGKRHAVDKMPMNYLSIGLIRLAFPNSKIIHTKRHPIDTCLSIYRTPNRSPISWANDKGNIAFAYRQYLRLMDHWRAVLPEGAMLEVEYEELVSEPEKTTRAMIHFCGLEWDDACLRPELNERLVVTPSVWQVRQPVYRTSVDRWKKYEPWLGAFRDL